MEWTTVKILVAGAILIWLGRHVFHAFGNIHAQVSKNSVIENERFSIGPVISMDIDDDDVLPLPGTLTKNVKQMMEYYNPDYRTTCIEPVVSIITTIISFDEAKLQETVSSVQHQSLQNWEWVICDNAEVENVYLKVFVEELREQRIRLVRYGHDGMIGARNFAISASKGLFYYILNDDDLASHHALEVMYFSLVSNPSASFVNGYSYIFGTRDSEWSKVYGKPEDYVSDNSGTYAIMARREHWQSVGGYDKQKSGGLEDYDFILRLMNQNKWGYTIPEFLHWYRTSASDPDIRWSDLREDELKIFLSTLPFRYPNIGARHFPDLSCPSYSPYQLIDTGIVQPNGILLETLPKSKQRLLLIVPSLVIDGANKFMLDFVGSIVNSGWEVTIATTQKAGHSWRESFARHTSDIFILSNFLPCSYYPRFLRHLLVSRNADVVMTSNTALGYHLVPFLAASCPHSVFVDYAHAQHFSFVQQGWAETAKGLSSWYDINFVSTSHLRNWFVLSGIEEENIKLLHVGVNKEEFIRNITARQILRKELHIGERATVVALTAGMDEIKQPLVMCYVASEILKKTKHHNLHFIVTGDGAVRGALENCVQEKKIDSKFSFLGRVSMYDMKSVLSGSDVIFLTSLVSGIPSIFYEAMASSAAVIGPATGGLSELVINDVTGQLAVVANGSEFHFTPLSIGQQIHGYSAALLKVLENPGTLKRMGEAAAVRIEAQFNLQKTIQKFLWLVNEKISKKSALLGRNQETCHRLEDGPGGMLNELATMGLGQGVANMDISASYCLLTSR